MPPADTQKPSTVASWLYDATGFARKGLKIAWVSAYDAANPLSYDGRGYFAPLSLEKQSVLVEHIGPFQLPAALRIYRKLLVARHRLLQENPFVKSSNRRSYLADNIPFILKYYGSQISRRLSKLSGIDLVCSGVNPGAHLISYLDCKQPIVMWLDTTFASAIDFYPQYFRNRLCPESLGDLFANERSALKRCRLAIFYSEWGARSAIEHYQLQPSRVKVVPAGGIMACKRTLDDVARIVDTRPRDK
jgi:hypothetical protein